MTLLRNTIRVVAAAAWLAGCGSSSTPIAPSYASSPSKLLKYSKTFHYDGEGLTFDVPEGVHVVTISATGANGAGRYHGNPGRVRARVPVTPGGTRAVFVGGDGGKGGYNGGGSGSTNRCRHCRGKDGGGASDVREGGDQWQNRVVVAGGGGGTGGYSFGSGRGYTEGYGGAGGGLIGGAGGNNIGRVEGGRGGSQVKGGPGGSGCNKSSEGKGAHGSLGTGGAGGIEGDTAGGGGGGGYYGGGGGGAGGYTCYKSTSGVGTWGGGGGGGSSYVESNARVIHNDQGYAWTGDGIVVIQW